LGAAPRRKNNNRGRVLVCFELNSGRKKRRSPRKYIYKIINRAGARGAGPGTGRGTSPRPELRLGGCGRHPIGPEVHRTSPRRNRCLRRGAASILWGGVAGPRRIPRQAEWQRRPQTLILSIINSTQKMRSYISSPPDMLCGPEISFYNFYNDGA
jgi:hypothetical protein